MRRILIIGLAMLACITMARAQYAIDAVRLAQPGSIISPRSAAMGNAFTGLSDDLSALYWNPAGLGTLRSPEFTFGMSYFKANNDANFLMSDMSASNSTTALNSIGFALPIPVARGSFVLAAGYNRITDFTNALSFSAYNPGSSIIPSLYDRDENFDLAWQVGVEDTSGYSPILNGVNQAGDVLESGSLNQWSFGGSMEVAPNLTVGVGLNIQSGSYKWERTFTETDPLGLHQGAIVGIDRIARSGFQDFTMDETISQDITGFNAKLGAMYTIPDKARFGLTITTPTSISVKEDFNRNGSAYFTSSGALSYSFDSFNDYDVTTPWVFTFGASAMPVSFVTVSGDVDLADYTQMEFSNASAVDFNVSQKNKDLKKLLRATTNYRLGLEVNIPKTDLFLRGGFNYQFTPFKDLSTDYDRKTVSFGVGYTFEHAFTVNAAYVMTKYTQANLNYNDPDLSVPTSALQTLEKIDTSSLMFSLSYRF